MSMKRRDFLRRSGVAALTFMSKSTVALAQAVPFSFWATLSSVGAIRLTQMVKSVGANNTDGSAELRVTQATLLTGAQELSLPELRVTQTAMIAGSQVIDQGEMRTSQLVLLAGGQLDGTEVRMTQALLLAGGQENGEMQVTQNVLISAAQVSNAELQSTQSLLLVAAHP